MRVFLAAALSLLWTSVLAQQDKGESELVRLVRQDCGSCHGMTLKGGLGLPLTPEALREKDEDALAATILWGRLGTAMPAWRTILTERDAEWIVKQLKSGFPEEVKK